MASLALNFIGCRGFGFVFTESLTDSFEFYRGF